MIRLAQIGLGYWGPNLFRNFYEHEKATLTVVCDCNPEKLKKIKRYSIPTTTNYLNIFNGNYKVDAVIIATPVATHFELVKAALEAKKHVFVEKPLTKSAEEGRVLCDLAETNHCILMVGHVFLFNPGIQYVRTIIEAGTLGRILCLHGQRVNFGPVRHDVNAIWDLASHDISIFNYWLGKQPHSVSASGSCILQQKHEDIASVSLYYSKNNKDICCQLLVSWLHPKKVRQITVVGDQKMVSWDDVNSEEMIRIYDRGIGIEQAQEQVEGTFAEFQFLIGQGNVSIPHISLLEPLKKECDVFIQCISQRKKPITDGRFGLDVVRVLEATSQSLKKDGVRIRV